MIKKVASALLAIALVIVFMAGCIGEEEEKNIVETLADDENHQTLVSAVQAAGLDEALSGEGPFTVFAPTDDAFSDLDQEYLNDLIENDTETLASILKFHVIAGHYNSTDLSDGMILTTLDGKLLTVDIDGSTVSIDGATVTEADRQCSNGVIHVIDAVMVPKPNIVEAAIGTGIHDTLVTAVIAAGLDGVLSDETASYTVFAPDDDAFAALDQEYLNDLVLNDTANLTKILTYHVVDGIYMSSDLSDGMMLETVNGKYIEIEIDGGVHVDGAMVTLADVECSNGVIHVIDAVMVPKPNIVEAAIGTGIHDSLVAAVIAAGLDGVLGNESAKFTVFAPDDDAFAALDPVFLNNLLENDTANLTKILTFHVVVGEYMSSDLSDGMELVTVEGSIMTISINGGVSVDGASVTLADVECSNGVIHVIDAVLVPPDL